MIAIELNAELSLSCQHPFAEDTLAFGDNCELNGNAFSFGSSYPFQISSIVQINSRFVISARAIYLRARTDRCPSKAELRNCAIARMLRSGFTHNMRVNVNA